MILINRVELVGRLTSKPELRYTNSQMAVTNVTVAVNRRFKNKSTGEYEADFISIKAFEKTAELLVKHFDKGSQIGISGRIQTGNYEDKDGVKRYTTDVIVEELDFIDSKKESGQAQTPYDYQNKSNAEIINDVMNNDPFAKFGESVSLNDSDLD